MTNTFIDVLEQAGRITDRGFTFLDDRGEPSFMSFAELRAEAFRRGRMLRAMGLAKGDRVAMILPEAEDFVLSFLGAVTAGIVPVPMFPPLSMGRLDGYLQNAARTIDAAGARLLLTTKRASRVLWSLVDRANALENVETLEIFDDPVLAENAAPISEGITRDDLCFLQFTSGSTAAPKGVVVTHAMLVANTRAICEGLKLDGLRDRGVSWLPLYHDMGLIGFVLAPLVLGLPVTFIPTLGFVRRPSIWLETISRERGTVTFAPNFALGLAVKRVNKERFGELDLSSLRVLGCAAEPINPETLRTFIDTFARAGLRPEAVTPCYGMAEATLAVAFADLDRPFATTRVANQQELVSCGRAVPGHRLAIFGEDGAMLADGDIGEIAVSGPSITRGYFENEAASANVLRGEWLLTGDLGFMKGGELFVSGRKKDLVILQGRNFCPQAIEWCVEEVDGVRRGNVVAFSVRGAETEELVVVAETKVGDRTALEHAIRRHLRDALGLRTKSVILLAPGQIPKTSSGKLQRAQTRIDFEAKRLGVGGDRTLGIEADHLSIAKHVTRSAFSKLRHSLMNRLTQEGEPTWPRRSSL